MPIELCPKCGALYMVDPRFAHICTPSPWRRR